MASARRLSRSPRTEPGAAPPTPRVAGIGSGAGRCAHRLGTFTHSSLPSVSSLPEDRRAPAPGPTAAPPQHVAPRERVLSLDKTMLEVNRNSACRRGRRGPRACAAFDPLYAYLRST
ncbi:hypothetical protein EVAR_96928_1 [Eumeta japonica]|uniref:Uncharacterized protein n=1 Tax=Eumeta variegata TaxID=151549 RepID=A0A4C1T9G1_EUMVA|nr:hypothetical protein EVAR_96928_1 [Eumeta japonica]